MSRRRSDRAPLKNKTTSRSQVSRETDLLVRRHGGDIRVHLLFPNTYWVGMSSLGFQTVLRAFAEEAGVLVERAFIPEESNAVPRTVETARPLADCDVLAVSLSFETDYLPLLALLSSCGLLGRGLESRLARPGPLILCGGIAVTANPEPLAEFVDAVLLGEVEGFPGLLLDILRRGYSRLECLAHLAAIDGVYIPGFYETTYSPGKGLTQVKPSRLGPTNLQQPRRRVTELKSQLPACSAILTPDTEFSSMLLVETGRGCEMGCRFCVSGYLYRPVRRVKGEALRQRLSELSIKADKIGLVGAAVSSHPELSPILSELKSQGKGVAVSSLMAQQVSQEFAAVLGRAGIHSLALAPEAGSYKLRLIAGKRVSDETFLEAISRLIQAGIRRIKLYFMLGLPRETEDDVLQIGEFVARARALTQGAALQLVVSVGAFIPKAFTPFQWEGMLPLRDLERRLAMLRKELRGLPGVRVAGESLRASVYQALCSRGDRTLGLLLACAASEGRDWKWVLSAAVKGQQHYGMQPLSYYVERHIPFDERLPWEIVNSGIDRAILRREAERAWAGESRPCLCGARDSATD